MKPSYQLLHMTNMRSAFALTESSIENPEIFRCANDTQVKDRYDNHYLLVNRSLTNIAIPIGYVVLSYIKIIC